MANFVYYRTVNGEEITTGSAIFLDIAEQIIQEGKDTYSFGRLYRNYDGVGWWDSISVIKDVVKIIQKAVWYKQVLRKDATAEEKEVAFLEYVKYESVRLNLEYAEYPWCPLELVRKPIRKGRFS